MEDWISRHIEDENLGEQTDFHYVMSDFSVSALDTSGISFLMDLKKAMAKRGLETHMRNAFSK
ncbi:hypothetical protein QJS10_CPB04g00372 [Acorus calamus]|uniref:STAS domain-containing protein n=1 Tax=Acorus calamus TaxID=4465 RepID=A0AAV9F2D9_ACOCL|nr:hypothetical protein QJS10_CPB04g00372 [Acorus calamus]